MASTYSSRLRLELMASGEQSGSWGTKTNTNLGTLIEEAIAGYESIATGDADVTLTTSNGATDQARKAMLKFTGTLTAIRNITVPSVSKIYVIHNGCTGFPILVKTSGGVGQYVNIGERVALYCDGSEVYRVDDVRPGYNAIINGDMNIAQRGTSFVSPATAAYNLDRYFYSYSTTSTVTITQSSDAPTVAQAGRLFTNSLNIQVTTADASIASSDIAALYQAVEGFNWIPLAQRTMTFSTWMKAKKTGVYCFPFVNGGVDRSYIAEVTVNAADTWEFKTVTVPASPSAGTWNYTNGVGIYVGLCLASGSTFQTTASAWQTGNYRATSSQVNALDSTANYVRITGWKLEPGSVATMSQPKIFSDELAECQRYYYNTFPYGTAPQEPYSTSYLVFMVNRGAAATAFGQSQFHPQTMRATPSSTIYSHTTGSGTMRDIDAGGQCTSPALNNVSTSNYYPSATSNAASANGNRIAYNAAFSAEL